MRHVPFVHGNAEDDVAIRAAAGTHARDVMVTDVIVAHEDEPIRDVLAAMLGRGRKIVPVVDHERRLTGMVDRADLLGVLAE